MYYHASQIENINVLKPRISNHNVPLIYFSTKRENVLVYLSNAIEKYCKETNFSHSGKWHKWATYGFEPDGTLRIDEYYPDAVFDTYKGVSGYIYYADSIDISDDNIHINSAVTSSVPVSVGGFEYIEDAYLEIIKAAEQGLIKIRKYEDMSESMLSWIKKTIINEYAEAENEPDYRYFLKAKFEFL
ncbi:MAG: hypothetical protein IJZ35_03905 [Clostridia bacterium]|nr:hypothetical protein [Clostridia bacterium]